MSEQTPRRQGINSIEVGLKIVKELVRLGRPVPLRDIARAAAMHPAKVHRYLVSFVRGGLVAQNPGDGHYTLGPYALELSLACLARLDAVRVGSTVLESLAAEINESVFLAVWGATGPTVVDWQPSLSSISASTHTGTVFPLLTSSTGQVFATYLSEAVVETIIEQELANLAHLDAPRAPRTREEVDALLVEVRERGLARGVGIRRPGINSFSAPVFDYRGNMSFAVTAFGYEDTFDPDWNGPIAEELRRTARELSAQLGYSGPPPTL
jgi:DNA-binding IclR family transcriptional regulator